MKQLARNYLWWEGLDADIERVCRECSACASQRDQPPPAPLHSWAWPTEPWERLNIDFLGPFRNKYYLVIIDAHSKWLEVDNVSSTSAAAVIHSLRKIFARFGLPKSIVSDNGPPFSSAEYLNYLNRNGIKRILVAPYHPSSNGAAENAVKLVKQVLRKATMEREDYDTALCKFLFTYRNTEHCTTQKEPSLALLGHRLRGRLDLLRPVNKDLVQARQNRQATGRDRVLREVLPGESVLVRNYGNKDIKWKDATVIEKTGPVSYVVKTKDDHLHKRHIDQIIGKNVRKSRHSLPNSNSDPGVLKDLPRNHDASIMEYYNKADSWSTPLSQTNNDSPSVSPSKDIDQSESEYDPQQSIPIAQPIANTDNDRAIGNYQIDAVTHGMTLRPRKK
ncbi:uncharacterized protein K02A2.6-like [Achroia grisella]|uniref:uncharacterized protein K02A2.6-like n=1 Tax=Achroia grisella TaxID=688607 RepID=UPI0027D33F2F|nr:uncharacterized protein K02A2.6-like [Achroia grisella]